MFTANDATHGQELWITDGTSGGTSLLDDIYPGTPDLPDYLYHSSDPSDITAIGDQIGPELPAPWSQTVRVAARSRRDQIPGALGTAISETLPEENSVEPWWRLVAVWQGLLLGCVVAGLAWIAALLVIGVFHAARHAAAIFSDVALLPWVAVLIVAILALGWLTASGCMSLVSAAALRERGQVEAQMRSRMQDVAEQFVLVPVKQELSEYARFCSALAAARR